MASASSVTICPTVTVIDGDPHHYREQIEKVSAFSSRVHIDLMDGDLAPTKSINPIQVWWPEGIEADIHLMYRKPLEHLETLVSLQPSLVVFHAEAEGDVAACMAHLKRFGIKAGVALLPHTEVKSVLEMVETADHVLIFAGNLGHFGGQADMTLTRKVVDIKAANPNAEIAWDGGINADNAATLAQAGIDVLDVGGFIQRSDAPKQAYASLVSAVTR